MMSFRQAAVGAALASAALLTASPAAGADYLFDADTDSVTITYDGFDDNGPLPGLGAELVLTLASGIGTDTLNFTYVLRNISTTGGLTSRVSGFAFASNPNVDGDTGDEDDGYADPVGDFTNINVSNNGNYANGISDIEVCLTNNNGASCTGGGNGGATLTDPATGSFSLIFGSDTPMVTLSNFYVRYQSINIGQGSASGKEIVTVDPRTPLPEPATWAMLLIGFGAVGATLRSRKSNTAERRLRVA